MLSIFSHPRFIVPIVLLAVLASLFLALERGTEANIRAMQAAMSEDVTALAKRIDAAGGGVHAEKRILEERFAAVKRASTNRKILFVLVSVAGLFLLGSLLCNARCYHRKFIETQKAERDLALFASALESTRMGVIIQDTRQAAQPIVFVNQAFTDLTGYDLSAISEKKFGTLFGWHTDKKQAEALTEAARRGEAATFDLLVHKKDGSSFWSEWHMSPVNDSDGHPGHYVVFLTDIAKLKRTQEALLLAKEQAERASHVKSNFLAMMSHEIRTPLNGLMGVLDLLQDSRLDEDQSRLLTVAVHSSRSLHEIINDILDYTKMEAGKITLVPQNFSVRELLQNVIDLLRPVAAEKNIALELDIDGGVPGRLVSDAGRMRQILLNLLTNAVKYTDQGSVKVRVANLLSQTGGERPSVLLRFEVIDTGIGISAADQDKLFEEFSRIEHATTRRFSGTGLGLAISRRLVKMLNGEIGVESKPGQGSKFWFMLPLGIDDAGAVNKEPPPPIGGVSPDIPREKPVVLLVEDNETNQLVASRYLEKAGCIFDVAATGKEAILCAERRPYDLILMDISMPDMDGFEATRKLRALGGWTADVPIIALTAHAMQGDRERCLSAGMNEHLGKPLAYDTLVKTIGVWSNARSPERVNNPTVTSESIRFETIPDIDLAMLHRLLRELGIDAVQRIASVFLNDSSRRMNEFRAAIDAGSLERIEAGAHTLKSSSANCGLMRFSNLMADVEEASRCGQRERLSLLLAGLDQTYEAARKALEERAASFSKTPV